MKTIDDLLPTLAEATYKGGLTWDHISLDTYRANIGKYHFVIWQWYDPDDDLSGYSASLREGTSLHPSLEGRLDIVKASQFGSKYAVLEEVYNAARRQYNNVDAVITDVEGELSKLLFKKS